MESNARTNPYDQLARTLSVGGNSFKFYDFNGLNDERIARLPLTVRVLLECAVRNCDEFNIKKSDVERILDWQVTSKQSLEIPFKPARVLCQDLTGVPLVVDLAAMRDAIATLGGNPDVINPQCPVNFVIDHSIQVDHVRQPDSLSLNEAKEFERNFERFQFLKWGQ